MLDFEFWIVFPCDSFNFITAITGQKEHIMALSMGVIDFINKPVIPTILKAKVASIIRNREIGENLHISVETVKTHIQNIYIKYRVKNRFEVITLFSKERENFGGN